MSTTDDAMLWMQDTCRLVVDEFYWIIFLSFRFGLFYNMVAMKILKYVNCSFLGSLSTACKCLLVWESAVIKIRQRMHLFKSTPHTGVLPTAIAYPHPLHILLQANTTSLLHFLVKMSRFWCSDLQRQNRWRRQCQRVEDWNFNPDNAQAPLGNSARPAGVWLSYCMPWRISSCSCQMKGFDFWQERRQMAKATPFLGLNYKHFRTLKPIRFLAHYQDSTLVNCKQGKGDWPSSFQLPTSSSAKLRYKRSQMTIASGRCHPACGYYSEQTEFRSQRPRSGGAEWIHSEILMPQCIIRSSHAKPPCNLPHRHLYRSNLSFPLHMMPALLTTQATPDCFVSASENLDIRSSHAPMQRLVNAHPSRTFMPMSHTNKILSRNNCNHYWEMDLLPFRIWDLRVNQPMAIARIWNLSSGLV